MEYGLCGKNAAVLAASRGLGFAVANCLAQEGCNVALCGRSADTLEQAITTLREKNRTVEVFGMPADVSCREDLEVFIAAAQQHLGPVDILVTNAGGPPTGTFEDVDDGQWYQAFDLNCMSAIRAIRLVLPAMKERVFGRIVAITSIAVKQPLPNLILSNAVRAGLTGCLKTLATEVASAGITVNCVCPGYTRTERLVSLAGQLAEKEGCMPEDIISRWELMIPAGRLAEPEEFAGMVCYLCSEQAGSVTGTSFWMDGGLYKGLL